MTTKSFEKNSVSWQLQQLQQQAGEWWELQTSRLTDNVDFVPPSWNWINLINWSLLWQITKTVLIVLVILLILWAAWQIWQLLNPTLYNLKNRSSLGNQNQQSKELSVAQWLARSQKLQQQGNYYQAFQCLYLGMLQQLNDRNIAPHQISRTDGEYLQAIAHLPYSQPYQFFLTTHQKLCFGNEQTSLSLLEECQQLYQNEMNSK
jgi:hypothetical protein